jgi:chemotaxis protein MotA
MKSTVIIGFVLGFGIIFALIFSKEEVGFFLNWPSLAITLGGTSAAVIVYFSPEALKDAIIAFVNIFTEKYFIEHEVVEVLVDVSKRSKKTSFRTIIKSAAVKNIRFLEKGLTLISDGLEGHQVEDILLQESRAKTARNRVAERVFGIAGSFAPMFGMMGTVIGLIAMLNQIDNPSAIPAAMGMALVTTLYGLILSALVFKPISGKIRDKNNIDTNIRNIIIEGIRSIQKGENSQITKEKLAGYIKEGFRK